MGEPLPDHSSLTRIRERYGVEVFRRFFDKIVEQCQAAGIVWGKEVYFDGTKVAANAGKDSLKPRFFPPRSHQKSSSSSPNTMLDGMTGWRRWEHKIVR